MKPTTQRESAVAAGAALAPVQRTSPVHAAAPGVPPPTVEGPIDSRDEPRSATKHYTFVATPIDLAARGYVGEEFLVSGTACRYAGVGFATASIDILKAWSPGRYGTLDVTANGATIDDALRFDICAQAVQALPRTDLTVPVLRLLSEVVVIAAFTPPDAPNYRHWEVAGSSHADAARSKVGGPQGRHRSGEMPCARS